MSTAGNVNLHYHFKNLESSEAIQEYAADKLATTMEKYLHLDVEAKVLIEVEKHRQIAELSFNYDGQNFTKAEETDDLYKSIDLLAESVGTWLRRHKDKQTSHHA